MNGGTAVAPLVIFYCAMNQHIVETVYEGCPYDIVSVPAPGPHLQE